MGSSRYDEVSRRAVLKATAGVGLAALIPGLACGTDDVDVFAGAVTDLAPQPTTPPVTVEPALAEAGSTELGSEASAEEATADGASVEPSPEASVAPTPTSEPTATVAPTATPAPTVAVDGELVISFTYTQGIGGKNERPYIAVWIEDAAGELVHTVSLWYEQGRRGARWLDHLTRWWEGDQFRISGGGADTAATISSATRDAGSYAVVWDGNLNGVPAPPTDYFVCIEAAREEGPYSLIREPLTLTGFLPATRLPDSGELSSAQVRVDV